MFLSPPLLQSKNCEDSLGIPCSVEIIKTDEAWWIPKAGVVIITLKLKTIHICLFSAPYKRQSSMQCSFAFKFFRVPVKSRWPTCREDYVTQNTSTLRIQVPVLSLHIFWNDMLFVFQLYLNENLRPSSIFNYFLKINITNLVILTCFFFVLLYDLWRIFNDLTSQS